MNIQHEFHSEPLFFPDKEIPDKDQLILLLQNLRGTHLQSFRTICRGKDYAWMNAIHHDEVTNLQYLEQLEQRSAWFGARIKKLEEKA